MKIVIIGGSFGGLTAAHELRRLLSAKDCDITLISKDPRFVFIPSLPWVTMGTRTIERISFELEKPLDRKRIRFIEAEVRRIDPSAKKVFTPDAEYGYDFLVIATGHRSANEAVPGLGPFDGPGHSLMSPPEAVEARDALAGFLKAPGPVVIGCAPGASCIGPAYEFAFELDHHLKKRGIRNKVPINFVTPEPYLGHFGVGGMGKARQFLEGEFEHRDIRYHTSAAVNEITPECVALVDGKSFDSIFSMIIPPLNGVKAIVDSPGLGNPKGFIPIDAYHRHKEFPEIYARGCSRCLSACRRDAGAGELPQDRAHDGTDGVYSGAQHRRRVARRGKEIARTFCRVHHGHGRQRGAHAGRSGAPTPKPSGNESRKAMAVGQESVRTLLPL